MATQHFNKRPSGSREPKAVGVILDEMLRSDSRLANAYRKFKEALAEEEAEDGQLFKNFHPDTHLCVDLKVITREPGRMPVGAYIDGVLARDGENHFTLLQNASEKKRVIAEQRNPHLYRGRCINATKQKDGPRLTFNRPRYTKDFTFADFCREAAEELLMVAGLLGK